ncbi:ectoine utilization protein EutA [Aureimonas sp. OT7]|uniref:ectoine utilization protein EutA n=1 Tax=Aureimonas TaxID=414371 RepID=UPI00177DA153|nr:MULTISPECIES: ectoine utilization protein EutA [Aureimonas]QOG07035.1 ectoine utilization protein EutA [Aureimonas sp. OT7]
MSSTVRLAKAPLRFDPQPVDRRIGLILLATDLTSEPDFVRLVAAPGVALHAARIAYANPTTPENLAAAAPRLSEAAALLLPDETLDAIVFSCTSASVVIGDVAVAEAIARGKPGVPVVTPPLAAVLGLAALGAHRVSVLTPYTVETSVPMARYFEEKGLELAGVTCLGLTDDRQMARISRQSIIEAAVAATADDAQALFISCTAVRAAGVIDDIEARIGRPVVTSNQASAWAALNHCGLTAGARAAGRLMRLPMPEAA